MPFLDEVLSTHGVGKTGLQKFFGSGLDGAFNSTGNTTVSVPTTDVSTIVKQYTSFTLNAGHTFSVNYRCRGLIIYSQGDVTINGTIDMDGKGAIIDPTTVMPYAMAISVSKLLGDPTDSNNNVIILGPGGRGGSGGKGGGMGTTAAGAWGYGGRGGYGGAGLWFGGGRAGGGGGAGVRSANSYAYNGTQGGDIGFATTRGAGTPGVLADASGHSTIYDAYMAPSSTPASPGAGGSAGAINTYYAKSASGSGGSSANGDGAGGGGSVCYPGSSGVTYAAQAGGDGTANPGGLIVIICGGNLVIGSAGKIYARGTAGAKGGDGYSSAGGGGGGGAGGGCVVMCHKGTYTLTSGGIVDVSGGTGGDRGYGGIGGTTVDLNAGEPGEPGSAGYIRRYQL